MIEINIPHSLLDTPTGDSWHIVDPIEKMKCKYNIEPYSNSGFNSIEYDAYISMQRALNPDWLNNISATDICVSRLMNSFISHDDFNEILKKKNIINAALSAIPTKLSLSEIDGDSLLWQSIITLFNSVNSHNIRLAKITKIFYLKRPCLIPILDSFVVEAISPAQLRLVESDSYIIVLRKFRELLLRNNENIAKITDEINIALARAYKGRADVPILSHVRVLETLIWFDWFGYSNYDNFKVDEATNQVVLIKK